MIWWDKPTPKMGKSLSYRAAIGIPSPMFVKDGAGGAVVLGGGVAGEGEG